ncbi:antitoxin [Enterococcus ureilyticus]|uniref:antitoxin n=1 Tax=Enterococcus TaxID=1350 RepID=UPI001A8D4064|nr:MULTISPECIES: antitoxin [Enterococcus]MBO0447278.1 antitoxin [Enterococcus ureilyticus]MBO0467999.1 antitoxin [Enterococcus plantarum]
MDYEKTFKVESLNEFSRNVYNRVLRYVVKHQIDRQNKNDLYAELLDQLKGMLQMNLFEMSMNDLAKVESYWNTMDVYTKSITDQKAVEQYV